MSSAWFTLTGVGVVLTWVVTSIQMLAGAGCSLSWWFFLFLSACVMLTGPMLGF
jgi:hypothetical protein